MKKTSLLTFLTGNILQTLLKLSQPWIVMIQQLLKQLKTSFVILVTLNFLRLGVGFLIRDCDVYNEDATQVKKIVQIVKNRNFY
jgi:hypothetical protein